MRRAAGSLRYAPHGTRGTCTQTRPAGFGGRRAQFVELARQMGEELVLVGLIESRKGAQAVPDMLRLDPGLDVVMIGRSDLASDLGKPGQGSDPEVERLTGDILSAVTAAPAACAGVAVYGAADAAQWAQRGCRFFAYPSEVSLLFDAARRMKDDLATACDAAPRP